MTPRCRLTREDEDQLREVVEEGILDAEVKEYLRQLLAAVERIRASGGGFVHVTYAHDTVGGARLPLVIEVI